MMLSTLLKRPAETRADALEIVDRVEGLAAIKRPSCAGVLWQRQDAVPFRSWLDALSVDHLPTIRTVCPLEHVRRTLVSACEAKNTPTGPERDALIDDISAMADVFAEVMGAKFLRVRLDAVQTNACRKFHVDAMAARLVCTYRGAGTQYGFSEDRSDPELIFDVPTGAPLLLRGSLWPETPRSGLLHRSPPIEGTGQTRLVLVLDPIFDPEDEM